MYHVTARKLRSRYQVDLSALMATCETNYWRIRKLLLPAFPELTLGQEFYFSLPAGGAHPERTMLLKVVESSVYTTTLEFSELSMEHLVGSEWGLSPRLTIRIYHDAKTSEVTGFQGQRHFLGRYDYPNPLMRARDEKWQLNSLLADWLNHCLQYGYCPVLTEDRAR